MFPIHDDNPTEITPFVTVTLILTCSLVFVWQISLGPLQERVIYALGAIPAVVLGTKHLPIEVLMIPEWATVISSMFLHGGWMHIIGNMLYLWIFGNNVEDAMGHTRFIIFYLLCGIVAFAAHGYQDVNSVVPTIGASGAISGVLGAYLLLYPHARVLVVIPIFFYLHTMRLPAGVVLAFWFALQLLNNAMTANTEGGGVAWGAHIGGFIAGMLLIPFFKKSNHRLFAPKH